jgi:adenylyltransferase/sulfurtransferase
MAMNLMPPDDASRYARQTRYPPWGEDAQRLFGQSRVLVCGCGGLGGIVANTLVRAGVGAARIVDRDVVETVNLHRQMLFDERDAAGRVPKAIAAAERLRRINSGVEIEPIVASIDHRNIERLCEGVDAIVDGTDNFETRFVINDAAVKHGIPWVYGGCLGAEGQSMTILPRETPCLRCLVHECPPPAAMPRCDTAGVLGPIVDVIASIEAIEAMKILGGRRETISRNLTVVDLWDNRIRQVNVESLRRQTDCPTCKHDQYPWLDGVGKSDPRAQGSGDAEVASRLPKREVER